MTGDGDDGTGTDVWVFDVDGTIIDSLTGTSLRPGTADVLSRLSTQGCSLLLWSAGGGDYARRRAVEHGLADLFSGFHSKQRNDDGYFGATFLADPASATFVDDRPEDLCGVWRIRSVAPYVAHDPHDTAMSTLLSTTAVPSRQADQR